MSQYIQRLQYISSKYRISYRRLLLEKTEKELVLSGERFLSEVSAYRLFTIYRINLNWLFTGLGDEIITEEVPKSKLSREDYTLRIASIVGCVRDKVSRQWVRRSTLASNLLSEYAMAGVDVNWLVTGDVYGRVQ